MTDAERESAAVCAWLRSGGFAGHWKRARFTTRILAAWIALRSPWEFAQASCKMAAFNIDRGEHLKKEQPDA